MIYPEKKQLRQFLQARGISYNASRKTWRCPLHSDEHESATLYENPDGDILYCPVCGTSLGIFDLCGKMDGLTEFKDMLKRVRETLNISDTPLSAPAKKKPASVPVPFPDDKKAEFEAVIKKRGNAVKSWKYKNAAGEVIALDVRYEKEGERKEIITFWYDGKKLTWTNTPVLIYGLERLTDDRPVLIHEGAKCADAGPDRFINLSWSGGSAKAHFADWSPLQGREVFILPDDDEPGRKAAAAIKKQLTHAKIVKPVIKAREIKPKGADIVEILQVMSADEITRHILTEHEPEGEGLSMPAESSLDSQGPPPPLPPDGPSSAGSFPFRILGIGEDGRANFITHSGRLVSYSLESMSKEKLRVLADRFFWRESFSMDGKISWEWAVDDIIRLSERLDYDDLRVRGRGAWRDGEKLSYHDGQKTTGEHAPDKIYLRLPRDEIGVGGKCASPDLLERVKKLVLSLSFDTPADAVRCLGWSVIAPFAGALKYRPSVLLTGSSGTGKSKVQERFMVPLSNCIWADMRTTSTAGIRSKIGRDARAVIFDEAGKENEKMKANFDEMLAFMRSNYSSNSPDAFKGRKDGGYVNYKLNSMFALASTDPSIENVQDENRILRINFKMPTDTSAEWKRKEGELTALMSRENCNQIRAYCWARLAIIMDLADRIVGIARAKTHRDHRASYADMLLASAFMVVWSATDNPTDEQIESMLEKYYEYQPQAEHRDEAEEIIDRLLDEVIEILYEHSREKLSIRECLTRLYNGNTEDGEDFKREISSKEKMSLRNAIGRYGVTIQKGGCVAIANQHHAIKKIIGVNEGYQLILKRHKQIEKTSHNVMFPDGKPRRCTIIRGLIELKHEDKTIEEQMEELI